MRDWSSISNTIGLPIGDKCADFGDTVGGGGNVEGGGQGAGGGRGGRLHATRRLKQRITPLTTVSGVSRGRFVYCYSIKSSYRVGSDP